MWNARIVPILRGRVPPTCGLRRNASSSAGANGKAQRRSNLYIFACSALVAATAGTVALRLGVGKLLFEGGRGKQRAPRRDSSTVSISRTQIVELPPASQLRKTHERLASEASSHRQSEVVQVDAGRLANFLEEQREELRRAHHVARRQLAPEALRAELQGVLNPCRQRISFFADWYFRYSTTYKLVGKASSSAARHAVSGIFRSQDSLGDAVSQDLQQYVGRKFEALVLRPAMTEPELHRAFVRALHSLHHGYIDAISKKLATATAEFVAAETRTASAPPPANAVVLCMDWATQLEKVNHVPGSFEKLPELSIALIMGGASVGKALGGATVAAASKSLSAKLVAPFASKAAAATLGKATVAGAAGGSLAGPLGAAVGAAGGVALGLGVDMGVNKGVELMQRPSFEADVLAVLDAIYQDWEAALLPPLLEAQDEWFAHADALLRAPVES